MAPKFYGWWSPAAAFLTFGLSVGVPYYNIGFFFDYFQRDFNGTRPQITLGFPIAAALTIWAGPLLTHRLSPRQVTLVGTAITALAFAGFANMRGVLLVYYGLWILYTIGYLLSGPIPHQLIVSHWFRLQRGKAMGIVYVGVGLLGSAGSFLVKALTDQYGFRTALLVVGGLMFAAWPIVMLALKDRPSDVGQNPHGAAEPPPAVAIQSLTFRELLASWSFWLLLLGSLCSIGSIGAANIHMKFVFLDEGFQKGAMAAKVWRNASALVLWSTIGGPPLIGYLADRFRKNHVMTATYFPVTGTIPLLLTGRPSNL